MVWVMERQSFLQALAEEVVGHPCWALEVEAEGHLTRVKAEVEEGQSLPKEQESDERLMVEVEVDHCSDLAVAEEVVGYKTSFLLVFLEVMAAEDRCHDLVEEEELDLVMEAPGELMTCDHP